MTQTTAADLKVTGTVTYTAVSATADAVVTYKAKIEARSTESISPACAMDTYGVTTLDAAGCAQIQEMLKAGDPETTVSCSLAAGNCDCRITIADMKMAQNFYTLTGSNVLESDDVTYDICVTGTTMLQKEPIAGNVSGVTRLQKK